MVFGLELSVLVSALAEIGYVKELEKEKKIILKRCNDAEERNVRAWLEMKVCGPTALPMQNPTKTTAAVSCFLV